MVRGSESMMGINVDPNEWDPQLFIHCQARSWLFFCGPSLLMSFILYTVSSMQLWVIQLTDERSIIDTNDPQQ